MLTIDLTTARRFILGKQGLWPGRRDGRGAQTAGAGFGLVGLRERAQQLGGRLEVVTARGVDTTNRRTAPLAGVAYSPWLFWDGRKESLWAQALGPLESAVEHGGSRTQYAHLIARHYRVEYEALFGPLPDLSDPARFAEAEAQNSDDTQPEPSAHVRPSMRTGRRPEYTMVLAA